MELFNTVKDAANKNRSELALAAGIVSYAGAILACRSRTLKAEDILEKHKKVQVVTDANDPERRTETDVTTKTDILLAYAETYWPVLLLFGIEFCHIFRAFNCIEYRCWFHISLYPILQNITELAERGNVKTEFPQIIQRTIYIRIRVIQHFLRAYLAENRNKCRFIRLYIKLERGDDCENYPFQKGF